MLANKSDLLENPIQALDIGVNMQKCVQENGIVEWFRASVCGNYIDEVFQSLVTHIVDKYRNENQQETESQDKIRHSIGPRIGNQTQQCGKWVMCLQLRALH